ncbi:MAG: methionine--tRNA ligase [Bacteroidetes bacterium]|nr:methionine--tRNA ligase [Bacteroidota bacterium]
MMTPKRYLVTSALPYANGPIHIGHIAGAYLPADIYVRYLKANQKDVAFICGSDEHGAAITLRAKKEGKSPREIVDFYHALMGKAFADFGIEFDEYYRTSSADHIEMSQSVFSKLKEQGVFETHTTEQYFDEEAQQFLADRYITGTCPKCSSEKAYGDQCEKCGSALSPTELIHPVSTLSGKAPVLRETTHWYLPMQNHSDWIREFIEKGILNGEVHHDPNQWKSHVVGQCLSWVDGGLQARAMTRDLDWGVPVPGEDGKVLYVWLDAPIGYITNTKVWAEKQGKNWEDYWKNDDTQLVHFIGKDNIVFHCIIFPIILKAHGDFILPKNVPANEFMNLEGDKISTSRNWAVWLHEYLEDFPNRQDEMRYVLASIMPEQKDSEFTWTDFKDRVNNELADIVGNFVNRVFVLTHKYFDGAVQSAATSEFDHIRQEALESFQTIGQKIELYRFREAQSAAIQLARIGNKLLTETEPWKIYKTDPEKTGEILNICTQLIAAMAIAFEPFLPFTAQKLKAGLNWNGKSWNELSSMEIIPVGHILGEMPILFVKITDEEVTRQQEKLRAAQLSNKVAEPVKEDVSFETFQNMDLRIVHVLEAEKVPKTKKLLKLKIQLGSEERTVISGIAESYEPQDLIGKNVLYLANLAPREIKGVVSSGMILMAENNKGELSLLSPERPTESGNCVR